MDSVPFSIKIKIKEILINTPYNNKCCIRCYKELRLVNDIQKIMVL